jgi:hypothetical protein
MSGSAGHPAADQWMVGYSRVVGDLGHRERSPLYLSFLGERLREAGDVYRFLTRGGGCAVKIDRGYAWSVR